MNLRVVRGHPASEAADIVNKKGGQGETRELQAAKVGGKEE